MLGRSEHAGVVTAADTGMVYLDVVGAWHYDANLPRDTAGLLPVNDAGAVTDWIEKPKPGERVVWLAACNESGTSHPRVWILRDAPVLATQTLAYRRPFVDDNPERTERLLRWCCPRCGDPIVAGHECGMDGGMP